MLHHCHILKENKKHAITSTGLVLLQQLCPFLVIYNSQYLKAHGVASHSYLFQSASLYLTVQYMCTHPHTHTHTLLNTMYHTSFLHSKENILTVYNRTSQMQIEKNSSHAYSVTSNSFILKPILPLSPQQSKLE